MFRRLFSMGGAVLLAAAVIVLTAQPAQAQRRGMYRGGGWYGGSGWGGSRGGYFGGYRDGFYGYGYRPFYGGSYGYRPFYGSYYSSPYYGDYGWSSGWSPGYYSSSYMAPSGSYTMPYEGGTPSYSSGYTPQGDTATNAAHVTVRAPANARVWIGGWETPNTGAVREFDSPSLTPGKKYSYEVKAQWEENGRPVTQTQEVDVSAGARSQAVFPMKQ